MQNKTYADVVTPILREAGEMLLPYFGKTEAVGQKSQSPSDVVTELDTRIEVFLAERLKKQDSSIAFVGEETGGSREQERFWLADPIDGTAHFMRGMPFCTTMIALIESGEVVFSAIYDFLRNEMYVAEKGKGATLNGRPICVSSRRLKDAYVSFETNIATAENREKMFALREKCVSFFQTICCGFEFALVASGKIEGRICLEPYGHDFDFAPGTLLVAEAGGVVANIGVSSYDFRNSNFLATNRVIYDELTTGKDAMFPLA